MSIPKRLLIIAPHPDDGMMGAGLAQRVLEEGGTARIVGLTAGDSNNAQGIQFVQRQGFKVHPNPAVNYGYYRFTEDERASRHLGLERPTDLIWLGYPDGGMWELLARGSRGEGSVAYRSEENGLNAVPYSNAYRPGAPYTYDSVLSDLTTQIRDFAPDAIVTSHPNDNHTDHAACFYFTRQALRDLGWESRVPIYHPFDTYVALLPTELKADFRFELPARGWRIPTETRWQNFELTPTEWNAKKAYIAEYRSQMSWEHPTIPDYHGTVSYLFGYLARNELYGSVAEPREDEAFRKRLNQLILIQRGTALARNVWNDLFGRENLFSRALAQ